MSGRLATGFWVAAYRARLDAALIPVFVRHRGDDTAGAVLVKVDLLDGSARLYARGLAFEGPRGWDLVLEGPEAQIEARVAAERARDRDLWVLEVEDAAGRSLLEEPGLDD